MPGPGSIESFLSSAESGRAVSSASAREPETRNAETRNAGTRNAGTRNAGTREALRLGQDMIIACHCGQTRHVADCPCGAPAFEDSELIGLEQAVLHHWEGLADGSDAYGRADRIVSTLTRLIAMASGAGADPLSKLDREFRKIQERYPLTPAALPVVQTESKSISQHLKKKKKS
jgi:hypothetical protein